MDSNSNIYISDVAYHNVFIYDSGGNFMGANVGPISSPDPGYGSAAPNGITVDATGNIYASDGGNDTVDVYAPFVNGCGEGCTAFFQYDFQPLVTLSYNLLDNGQFTLSWSGLGIQPGSSSCTLSVYDGANFGNPSGGTLLAPPSGTVGQSGTTDAFSSTNGYGYAVITCPGATNTVEYEGASE